MNRRRRFESVARWSESWNRLTDRERAKYVGPRVGRYIRVWEFLKSRRKRAWIYSNDVSDALGLDRRQGRRLLFFFEAAGLVELEVVKVHHVNGGRRIRVRRLR